MRALVIRLSAIGDVVLTLPVLRAALDRYPQLELVMLTRPFLHGLFEGWERVSLPKLDLADRHKGPLGLWRLGQELQEAHQPDLVIDLHDVLRSKILRQTFALRGIPVHSLHKDRAGRQRMTRRQDKDRRPLPHSLTQYAAVFARAGLPLDISPETAAPMSYEHHGLPVAADLPRPWVGVGPFASKVEKMYPLPQMRKVMDGLAERGGTVFLFGGPADRAWFDPIVAAHPQVYIAPIDPLGQELALIQALDLMISVDSANTHLARLVGTRTLSIWGPTHPDAGFGPLGSYDPDDVMQIPVADLPCRPCSVVTQRPCYRGDRACMTWIQPEDILNRVQHMLEEA